MGVGEGRKKTKRHLTERRKVISLPKDFKKDEKTAPEILVCLGKPPRKPEKDCKVFKLNKNRNDFDQKEQCYSGVNKTVVRSC